MNNSDSDNGFKGFLKDPCGCLIPKGHKRQSLHKINLKKELCNGLKLVRVAIPIS
jgi:hypothetical protein